MEEPPIYRQTVSSLRHAYLKRPDLAFFVNKLCQIMALSYNTLADLRIRTTVYHDSTLHRRSHLHSLETWGLQWRRWPRSTGEHGVYFGRNTVSWPAKKQPPAARSPTEAEHRAAANVLAELVWIRFLLQELGWHVSQPAIIWCDNVGAA